MDKKNVISLVLGLIIGALAIWLVMSFTSVGSTMIIGIKTTPTPTATPTTTTDDQTLPDNFDYQKDTYVFVDGTYKSVATILDEAGVTITPKTTHDIPLWTRPCDAGRCQFEFYAHNVTCGRGTCPNDCIASYHVVAGRVIFACNCTDAHH